jgi:hypothetical protein
MTLQRYEKKSTPPTFSPILFKAFFQTNLVEEKHALHLPDWG